MKLLEDVLRWCTKATNF